MYRNWSQLRASSHEPGCRPDSARFPRFRLVFFDVFTWKGGLARFPKISVIKRAGNFAIWTLQPGCRDESRMNSGGPDGIVLHCLLYFPRYKVGTGRSPGALSVQQKFLFEISEIPRAQWNGSLGARGREHISDFCTSPMMHLIWPPKFCITFVFHFSWIWQPPQEKLKTMHLIKSMQRLFEATRLQQYPGYQRFFLACDGELRFVGRRPTRVRPKAEDTSGVWPKPETAHLAPGVLQPERR